MLLRDFIFLGRWPAVMVTLVAVLAVPAVAQAELSWSAPVSVEGAYTGNQTSIACPTATQCTAVDYAGYESTFNPLSPGSATPVSIDDGTELWGVACPSTSQCTAVDADGYELTFNPASPGVLSPIGVSDLPNAVACPTATQCTAVDYAGYESTFNPQDPNSGTGAQVDPGGTDLFDVACPTTTQCTAVGDNNLGANYFEVTFNPQAPPPPITIHPTYSGPTPVSINSGVVAVACPTATQCTAVGSDVEETFNPQNPGAPTPVTVDSGGGLAAIACPVATQCIAVGGSEITFNPTSPGAPTPTSVGGDGVACPTADECVAISATGYETTGTAAAGSSDTTAPTASSIKSALNKALAAIAGKNVKIKALLKNDGYKFRVSFPGAGKLVIDWYAKSKGKRALIARATASHAKGTVKLKLNKTGRKLLKNARKLKITEEASFIATTSKTTTLTKTITLAR